MLDAKLVLEVPGEIFEIVTATHSIRLQVDINCVCYSLCLLPPYTLKVGCPCCDFIVLSNQATNAVDRTRWIQALRKLISESQASPPVKIQENTNELLRMV